MRELLQKHIFRDERARWAGLGCPRGKGINKIHQSAWMHIVTIHPNFGPGVSMSGIRKVLFVAIS
jgi:hypothetical protein